MKKPASGKYTTNLPYASAPPYVLYPNVLRGYRTGGTYVQNLLSLFELHTETLNAWTMLAGAILSSRYLYIVLTMLHPSLYESLGFLATTLGAVLHCPFSVGFHLFRGMDKETYNLWRRLDQIFIFVSGVLFCFGISYYVFTLPVVFATTCVACLIATFASAEIWNLNPDFRRNKVHMFFFVGTIGSCFTIPALYQGLSDAFEAEQNFDSLWNSLGMVTSLFIGGVFYASGTPEAWFPGRFDLFLSSHQLMHIFVVSSHFFQYNLLILAYQKKHLQID